jgi:uncharacterized protein
MPMKTFLQNEPLTDAELDRLGDFLESCKGGSAMNIEALDGFFAALIAGPESVMPSEYYPEVFGGEMSYTCEFASLDDENEILGLMTRHWKTIAGTLIEDKVYLPLLLEDENGTEHGNDWAIGFLRGVDMRHDGWEELVTDEQYGGCVLPMVMLCYEHEDSELRPDPISPSKREKIIAYMAAGLLQAYRYFRKHREAFASTMCPCGSRMKFRRCCGGGRLN